MKCTSVAVILIANSSLRIKSLIHMDGAGMAIQLTKDAEDRIKEQVDNRISSYATWFGVGNIAALLAAAAYIIFALPSQTESRSLIR